MKPVLPNYGVKSKPSAMAITRYDCITCKVRDCSILNECDKKTLTTISTYKISKILPKGDRLFSEGDPIRGIYFIKKGFLKVELNGKQGRPLILQVVGKGTVLGHRLNDKHRNHKNSVTAVSEVQYCYIPNDLFEDIVDKSPGLKEHIINQFLDDLELAEKKAVNLAHKTVRERIAESLLLLAVVYHYEENKHGFRIGFGRQDIADLAGTTKEQVSKILKDFEKEGLVKFAAKKFNYLNTKMLQNVSSYYPTGNEE